MSNLLLRIINKIGFINSPICFFILACLMGFFIAGAQRLCIPVLFKDIAADLNLSLVELGTIWGIDPLAGFFISIPGGLLVDRFGVKRSAIAVCLLGGIFCALRGFSSSFAEMALITFLFGFTASMVMIIVPKITAIWFRGHHLGLTNAVFLVAIYAGQMTATMFSATLFAPLLGGWRNVLFAMGIPTLVLGILWFTTRIQSNDLKVQSARLSGTSLWQMLAHVIRIKEIWIMGLIVVSGLGTTQAVNGYLPMYLRELGWSAAEADGTLTLLLGVSMVGTIPIIFLSDRIKSLKPMFIISMLLMAVSLAMLLIVDKSIALIFLVIYGIVRSVAPLLVNIYIIEIPEVGSKYAGTAVGLANTLGMLGGFFIPPAGNAFAQISPEAPLMFWAVIPAVFVSCTLFIKSRKRPGRTAA